jgi:hypothetical protein
VNAPTKLGLFGAVLAAALGLGATVGAAVGPVEVGASGGHTGGHQPDAAALPAGGLLVSQDGYTFAPVRRQLGGTAFRFTITGPDGAPLTEYEELHDRELHLIVASRDLLEYAHVHPTRDPDGVWSVDLPRFPGGPYRAFADFRPAGGDQLTLGIDVTAPGAVAPGATTLSPSEHDTVAGFDVSLDADPEAGTATVTVRRGDDVVVTDPYLGAAGHLVALRDGDLAYLHVHPLDDEPAGPVAFAVEYLSAGTYALFFDFQVDGEVHTARFVVDAGGTGGGHDEGEDH